jgi:signal transduction histidine kinase
MGGPADNTPPNQSKLYRFLDRALLWLESATVAAVLLITLARPTQSRIGISTWALVLLFAGYSLLADLLQNRARSMRAFKWKYIADLPVTALVYFIAGEAGGPLFVFFVLAVDCAAATLTLRGTLIYTGAAVVIAGGIDLSLAAGMPSPMDVRLLLSRLAVLALVGLGMALLTRRLSLEQETARAVRYEARRLEELDRLREDFISTVSHDLKTPLTAARAGLGMLEAGASDLLPADERELLRDARLNMERLGLLIEALLALNELGSGTLDLEREPLDLRTLALGAMSAVHSLIREKGQALEVDLVEPLPVEGDHRRLEQAVVNLLANAHRHTPPGARIRVSGRLDDAEVLLCVSDNGPGIPAQELGLVFQRFHRAGAGVEGSGLGLAIAKGIVELHGGRIWAESEPGGGAAFYVALPRGENGEESSA